MGINFPNSPGLGQLWPVPVQPGVPQYRYDGEKWVTTSLPAPNTSGVIAIQVFTASGTYIPSPNMTTCVIECVGGGGGGGGVQFVASKWTTASGGGSGAYARRRVTAATIGPSQTVTIGAAGIPGGAANNGAAGGSTSVGTLCVASGGAGGAYAQDGAQVTGGGVGGQTGTGDIVMPGSFGGGGCSGAPSQTFLFSGWGGASYFGAGPTLPTFNTNGVNAIANTGAGGTGAQDISGNTNRQGGFGGSGVVIITEYGMTALSGTSDYAVHYDLPQALTSSQQAQARSNIGALKKNYIINGGMQISQENGTTAVAATGLYPVDMFSANSAGTTGVASIQQVAAATPAGSPNRLRFTVTTADAAVAAGDIAWIETRVEGLRAADLRFGSTAARTITIQFGVKAPAGTYCLTLINLASNRSYVTEYVITAADVTAGDAIKSITIPGDTSGTWASDSTACLLIRWGLMAGTTYQSAAGSWSAANAVGSLNQFNFMGTAGNVFELFDVGLYEGPVAPPFQVPDYASELLLCQRYYNKGYRELLATAPVVGSYSGLSFPHPVQMRAVPTVSTSGGTLTNVSTNAIDTPTIYGYRHYITSTGTGLFAIAGCIDVANARL